MPVRFLYMPIENAGNDSPQIELLGEYLDAGAELIACTPDRNEDGGVYALNILIYEPVYKLTDHARAELNAQPDDNPAESTINTLDPDVPF